MTEFKGFCIIFESRVTERERVLSRYSNIPQTFFLGNAVITHPTEGDSAGSNRGVGAYVLRLQVPDHKANTYIENNMKKRVI